MGHRYHSTSSTTKGEMEGRCGGNRSGTTYHHAFLDVQIFGFDPEGTGKDGNSSFNVALLEEVLHVLGQGRRVGGRVHLDQVAEVHDDVEKVEHRDIGPVHRINGGYLKGQAEGDRECLGGRHGGWGGGGERNTSGQWPSHSVRRQLAGRRLGLPSVSRQSTEWLACPVPQKAAADRTGHARSPAAGFCLPPPYSPSHPSTSALHHRPSQAPQPVPCTDSTKTYQQLNARLLQAGTPVARRSLFRQPPHHRVLRGHR